MNEKWILGLDIGGANTKAAIVIFNSEKILESYSYIEHFPFWEKTLDEIPQMLKRIINKLIIKIELKLEAIDSIAITITAELSDAFQTKKEGILTILEAFQRVFDKRKLFFITNRGDFIDFETARRNYRAIAGANWVSTALFLGNYIERCILIDAGSTTIDIIPILNSKPITKGKDDISRLIQHELVYTGGLRATIPSITHFVPYKETLVRIPFEKFALISDVHLILGNISEDEYINETADKRSKSMNDCYARLARIICMDLETISKEELDKIAKFIYSKQLETVKTEIKEFLNQLIKKNPDFSNDPLFIITGLAADFLIRKALKSLGYNNFKTYEQVTHISDKISSSALAVAGAFYFQNQGSI